MSLLSAQLRLKIVTSVMMMQNLHDQNRLYNDTRLVITQLHRYYIEVQILDSRFDNQTWVSFYALLITNKGDIFFLLIQKQFSICVCFAITINKSQGQSLDLVGIDLRIFSFIHGQLYLVLSRITDISRLVLLFKKDEKEEKTENIVFPEVFLSNQQWQTWHTS